MSSQNEGSIVALVQSVLGEDAGQAALDALAIDPALLAQSGPTVSRAAFAMAMNVILFHDLLERVPSGAAYVADTLARARHYGQRAVDAIGGFRSSQAKAALTEAVAFAVARAY